MAVTRRKKGEAQEQTQALVSANDNGNSSPTMPRLGQAMGMMIRGGILADAQMAIVSQEADEGQARISEFKAVWIEKIQALAADYSAATARIVRNHLAGQRPLLIQMMMATNMMAMCGDPESRTEIETTADLVIEEVMTVLDKLVEERTKEAGAPLS